VRVLLLGAGGKVGSALAPRLAEAGHEVTGAGRGESWEPDGHDVAVDFTRPDAVRANAERCLGEGVPCVVGTSGLGPAELAAFDALARERAVACFVAPNFAIGAVLMMRFAAEASRHLAAAEIIEYHHAAKLDAPSGTAARTAELMEGDVPIHSLRLPGLISDQDVVLGDLGQTLTIRHVTTDVRSFMPGVLLAVRRVAGLPDRLTVGLERLLWPDGAPG
jgi:4-hydroxy-tetrahydrodipicolinate reductase